MKRTKRMVTLGLALLLTLNGAVLFAAPRKDRAATAAAGRITDLAGRQVALVQPVTKVVAIAGPSYEKVFMLGQAGRLAGAHFYMVDRPWVKATNPGIATVAAIRSPAEPNLEALIDLGTDCVFFWDYAAPLASMENAGIPVVVVQQATGNPRTVEEFITYQKREVQVFADALGAEAQAKARAWFDYLDKKVAYVKGRTAAIPEAGRKTAIYAYGEDGLGVFSQYSYVSFWLELAGGRNIADETRQEMDTEVTMEQVIAWNPDAIFMGRMESADAVLKGRTWAQLKAVKNGQVHLCPDGVMYWDYSSEGVLLMQFLAQKLYPELFPDLDMVLETQSYYKQFYNYDLSAENAGRLLSHLAPL
ncbi:iron ABC transporter substrate-binding protein [Spirochaetia bacterium]|nr:iron ABC transporter substrate-binding protein [Spirochaetia bacterium]